jgi:hypothetical protein
MVCQFCKFGDRKRAVVSGSGVCLLLERTDIDHKITDWSGTLPDCPLKRIEKEAENDNLLI